MKSVAGDFLVALKSLYKNIIEVMEIIMRNKLIALAAVVLIVLSYMVGSYFVDFSMRRTDPNDIDSGPPACANIHDPTRTVAEKPDYLNETWSIVSEDGLKLNATYFSSDVPTHHWAILVHGYGRDQRYAWDYADPYLERGYNVLTPDLRASGTSEGEFLTMGVKESDDLLLWIDRIVKVDPKARITLHGVSMGAATVMITAGKSKSPNLVAVIEDCGYTSAYNMFTMQLKVIFNLPAFPIMHIVDIVSHLKTGASVTEAAPILFVGGITVPVLFIHGTEDKLVPYYMMQELYDACRTSVKEIFTVEGAGHADSKNINPTLYFNRIFSFLDQYIEVDDIENAAKELS